MNFRIVSGRRDVQENGDLKNVEFNQLYQTPDTLREIKKKQLQRADHAWIEEKTLIRMIPKIKKKLYSLSIYFR